MKRKPDFQNGIAKVLQKQKPIRPTLFEFLIDNQIKLILAGYKPDCNSKLEVMKFESQAYINAGYDFAPVMPTDFRFIQSEHTERKKTYSLNSGTMISDQESYDRYQWVDPENFDYDVLKRIEPDMPDNFKFMIVSPNGILENLIGLTGYETLCYMLEDSPELVQRLIDDIGSRILRYNEICLEYDSVGIVMCNDDWGFKNSTMLSHSDLKKYLYPWYRKIIDVAHKRGKFAVMHSCGNFDGIYEDLYTDLKFDGKHSNEDTILPVEKAYAQYHTNIAILGGIDIDFMVKNTPEQVYNRCVKMLELSEKDGAYALGSGNSIADYVPAENYFALLRAVGVKV